MRLQRFPTQSRDIWIKDAPEEPDRYKPEDEIIRLRYWDGTPFVPAAPIAAGICKLRDLPEWTGDALSGTAPASFRSQHEVVVTAKLRHLRLHHPKEDRRERQWLRLVTGPCTLDIQSNVLAVVFTFAVYP